MFAPSMAIWELIFKFVTDKGSIVVACLSPAP